MKYLIAGIMIVSAGQSAAISNLKVATETGNGIFQLVVGLLTFVLAMVVLFSDRFDR